MQKIVLAGGCFWCTEAIFRRLKGVIDVTSGYAGGQSNNPTYEEVSTGQTGFAEAVLIIFNPKIITFEHILDIFWAIFDPTTINKQGPDIGTQYRSIIFYENDEQKKIALNSKEKAESSGYLGGKIVTQILPLDKFYRAEDYHQNYYETNKSLNPYCLLVIDPKIQKLLDKFNADIKEKYYEKSKN